MVPDPRRFAHLPARLTRPVLTRDGRWSRRARHPASVAAILACFLFCVAAFGMYRSIPPGHWPVLKDSVIFEYVGWYLSDGNRLYIDVWEVKPPLAFELTALLSILAGDDVVLYHVLNLLVTAGAAVCTTGAVAAVVDDRTDDSVAAVVAGLAAFTFPYYFLRALVGFKSKYFVVAAGVLCLYVAARDRPVVAGVAGAVTVGFWQLALVFPLCGFGRCWQTGGRRGATRFVGGATLTGLLVLLPVALQGAIPAMVAEVVLSPLLVGGKTDLVARFAGFVEHVDRAAPVVLVGLAGLAGSLRRERIQHEWPWLVVIGWFSAQILLLDYDAPPDAFPWLVGLSVGVGFGVAALRRRAAAGDERAGLEAALHVGSRLLPATLLALTLVSVATMGSYGVGHIGLSTPTTYDTATELEPDLTRKHGYNGTESQYVYWNRVDIDSCRAFGAKTQRRLVTRTGMGQDWDWQTAPCGQFGPVWDGVVEEFGLPQWLLSRA